MQKKNGKDYSSPGPVTDAWNRTPTERCGDDPVQDRPHGRSERRGLPEDVPVPGPQRVPVPQQIPAVPENVPVPQRVPAVPENVPVPQRVPAVPRDVGDKL